MICAAQCTMCLLTLRPILFHHLQITYRQGRHIANETEDQIEAYNCFIKAQGYLQVKLYSYLFLASVRDWERETVAETARERKTETVREKGRMKDRDSKKEKERERKR